MNKLMIGYDLFQPGQDYGPLIERLRQLGAEEVLISQWMLVTKYTAAQIRDDLRGYIDSNDRLLVVALTGEAAWTNLAVSHNQFKAALRAA